MISIILKNKWFALKRTDPFNAHVLRWISTVFIIMNILLFDVLLGFYWKSIITSTYDWDLKIPTVFFLLLFSFIRIIISPKGDHSCIQYIHFPVSKKSILLYHILINLVNPIWLLIILWISIIGLKELFLNGEWMPFFIWQMQMGIISLMFEMGIMLVIQVFKKKNIDEFLFSLVMISVCWILSVMIFLIKCNEIIRNGILTVWIVLFAFLFFRLMRQVLFLDFDGFVCRSSKNWRHMKWFRISQFYFPMQFQILNRNQGLRNDMVLGLLITMISIFFHESFIKGPLSTIKAFWISFFCAGSYFNLRYLNYISRMDRKSAGFYRIQPVPISALIHSRVLAVNLFHVMVIGVNILGFLLRQSLIPILSISLSVFLMGTLSYCIYFGSALRFEPDMQDTELTLTNIQFSVILPVIFLHLGLFFLVNVLFGEIFPMYRLQDFWKAAIPGIIGLAGLIYQKKWIEKIGKKYVNPV